MYRLRGSKKRRSFRKTSLIVGTIAIGTTGWLVTGASAQVTSPTTENYAVGKVDHTFSNAHSVSAKYSWDKAQVDQDRSIPFWTTDTRTKSRSLRLKSR